MSVTNVGCRLRSITQKRNDGRFRLRLVTQKRNKGRFPVTLSSFIYILSNNPEPRNLVWNEIGCITR